MADKRINVVSETGDIVSLPESQIEQALFEKRISGVATPEQVAKAESTAKYGTATQQAITAAESVASGATFGISKLAEKAYGVAPADIAARAAENPVTAVAGETVGVVAPSLFTGGGTLAGRGALGLARGAAGKALAATPAGLLETGARAAESAIAGRLGTGMAARAAEAVLPGAMWGAAGGAGQEITEQVLGDDPKFNAEALLASIGTGAILGGGLTGVSRLLGDTLAKGAKKLGEKVNPETIHKFSNARAFDALGEGQLQVKQLERAQKQFGKVGYKEEIGAIAKEEGLFKGLVNGADDIHPRAVEAMSRNGKELENIYSKIDESAIARHPDRAELAEELRLNVLIPLQQSGANADRKLASKIERDYLNYFLEPGEQIQKGAESKISFTELWKKRQYLDDSINFDITGKPASKLDKNLHRARRVIEDYLENKGQDAASSMGEDFLQHYVSTKRKYSAMKIAADISKKRDLLNQTHQNMGWEPFAASALIGGATGMATGDMSLGAAGAAIGGFAASRFQQQVSTLLKKYGSSAMAVGLDDIGKRVAGISKVIDNAVDSLTGAARKAVPLSMAISGGETLQARFDEKAKQYDALTPEAVGTLIENKLRILGPVAPETLAAMKATTQAAVAHIQQSKPRGIIRNDDLFTGLDKAGKIGDREMAQWLRTIAAAENPMSVIRSAANNQLTGEGADTLRKVYPSLYNRASEKIITRYGQAKKRPPSSQTRTASRLLGSPVASYHSPRFTASCQKLYATAPKQPSQTTKTSIDKAIEKQYSGAQALEMRRS